MKREPENVKIKLTRPMIYNQKAVEKDTVLTVTPSEAKRYINMKKAVPAGAQKK
jgi:hypothetical protein